MRGRGYHRTSVDHQEPTRGGEKVDLRVRDQRAEVFIPLDAVEDFYEPQGRLEQQVRCGAEEQEQETRSSEQVRMNGDGIERRRARNGREERKE